MSDDVRGNVVKSGLWRQLSASDKLKWRNLSVQYVANKRCALNKIRSRSRGVSLQMLESAGVLGVDPDDPQCNKFVSDLAEAQADVALFVRDLAPLHIMAQHWRSVFKDANSQGLLAQLGDMDTFFQFLDSLVHSLDVCNRCPQLAPEHADPGASGGAAHAQGDHHPL